MLRTMNESSHVKWQQMFFIILFKGMPVSWFIDDCWINRVPQFWTKYSDLKLHQISTSIRKVQFNPRTPRGGGLMQPPLAFFPCNFFYDSNRKNRLSVSVTRDGRHILTYVTSSWRCHVTYVMTSYVHDGGQNTLFLPLFVNRDIFWCRCDKVMRSVSFSTKSRS